MATALSITTNWTTCPICLEVFNNPKSLPCIHGFCLKCLERHFKDNSPGDEVPCPLCRKEFKVPADGLSGLQHHFFIQHLVDTRNVASIKSTAQVLCEVCVQEKQENEGDFSEATVYCIDCKEKLCKSCSEPHLDMKSGAHQVRSLGAELEQELIQLRRSSCDQHRDKKVEFYCHECGKNICLTCSAVKHRNHERVEIADVANKFKLRMKDDDKKIMSGISALRQQSKLIKEAVLNFQGKIESYEKQVMEAGEEIKRKVDEQVKTCLEELQSVKAEGAKQAGIVQEQMQLAFVAMKSFHTYSRELLDKGRPSDITRAASELHKRATELLDNDVTSAEYCPPEVTFTPADVNDLMRRQLIGNIDVDKVANKTVGNVHVLHTLPKGKPVYGVTFLDSLLYVLRAKSTEHIEVYDTDDSYSLQRCISVPRLQWMSDIIACAHNRCLYVSGHYDKCVYRVGLLPDSGTTQWSVKDFASCLSLSDANTVFVSCPKVRKIKEFSSEGTFLREVQLPQDVVALRHAVQLPNGQFVLCHGDANDPVHRVCVLASDGHVVKSYGGPIGSGSQQMNGPTHLAVDRNGFVHVADCKNCRALLLSPDLTYVSETVSSDQLDGHPFGLSLDVRRRRLYVAEGKYGAGRVVVVSI